MIDQNQFSKKCENIIFMHRLEREGKGSNRYQQAKSSVIIVGQPRRLKPITDG